MECSCVIDYGEECDLWIPRIVRARREYKCCECGETIELGQKHEVLTTCLDRDWRKYRTCLICAQIRKDFCCPVTGVRQALRDCLGIDFA